jgi:hypothetical protein
MLSVRHFLMVLPLALFPLGGALAGCSGEYSEQDEGANEQFLGAVEQTRPDPAPDTPLLYGSWAGQIIGGQLNSLVLMTDGQFHSTESLVCVKAPCDAAVSDGRYKVYAIDSRTYIEFGDPSLTATERYEYAVAAETLRLRPALPGSEWYALERAPDAWCSNNLDCNAQNLPPGVCAGSYVCAKQQCAWTCGPIQ